MPRPRPEPLRLRRHDRIDLAAIAAEALRSWRPEGLRSVISLGSAWTAGDPSLIERLIANLVSNAIRHNVIGGRIEIVTRAESGRAVLIVANTGPLVPAAELRRLFRPFQRFNSDPRSFSDGVGLGLAIVKAIADVHDATVTATARMGGGLEIHVSFPATLVDNPTPRRKEQHPFESWQELEAATPERRPCRKQKGRTTSLNNEAL